MQAISGGCFNAASVTIGPPFLERGGADSVSEGTPTAATCCLPPAIIPNVPATDRQGQQRLAVRLEYATIAWNLGEAVLTIGLGIAAASLAPILFSTVSLI